MRLNRINTDKKIGSFSCRMSVVFSFILSWELFKMSMRTKAVLLFLLFVNGPNSKGCLELNSLICNSSC